MHRILLLKLSIFAALSLFAQASFAQQIPSEGRDFYLGMLFPSYNTVVTPLSAPFFKIYAVVNSYQDNVVSISYFDLVTGVEGSPVKYIVKARQSTQIQLDPPKLRMQDPGDQIKEYRSIHITAEKPVSIEYFSTGPSSCGSYLALSTGCLGKKYVIASYNDNPDGENALIGSPGPSTFDVACGYFMIIGAYNGTVATITPTSTTQGGKHTGVRTGPGADGKPHPYTISLNRGQCYMVKSWCESTENDITGSIVESDKPIAVLAGHENAALGDLGGRHLEGRDYMVEQMIPVDYWDTTGYVSMPLVDSSPLGPNDTPGDNYRVFTYDSLAKVQMTIASLSGSVDMSISRYTSKERFGVEVPVHVYSSDSHKFGVMLYDQANQSSSQPFPRPSMMTIVPMSRWRNAYTWYVPANERTEVLQSYYVNIIGPKGQFDTGIHISKSGGAMVNVGNIGQVMGSYLTFPDHPELKGVRYKLGAGTSLYAHANFPFMVYSYGYQAVDQDGDLGDFDGDDYFYEYANPAGLSGYAGNSPKIKVSVDTGCARWTVTVTDQNPGGFIRSVSLLDDPGADLITPPLGHAPYQYDNCSFDAVHDPLGIREINLPGTDTAITFTVLADDPSRSSYAPIYIVSSSGTQIIELRGSPLDVSFIPSVSTIGFTEQGYNQSKDTTIVFINNATSKTPYVVTSVSLANSDSVYSIISVTPPLPVTISPGDSLFITLRYTTKDTLAHANTLSVVADCFTKNYALRSSGGAAVIWANDINFGKTPLSTPKCVDTLRVKNIGTLPFTLGANFILPDTEEFKISATSLAQLPKLLAPGESVSFRICYEPLDLIGDSVVLKWQTDIDAAFLYSSKSYSILNGNSLASGVKDVTPIESFSIHPNPSAGKAVAVSFTLQSDAKISFTLLDVLGKKIYSIAPRLYTQGDHEIDLNTRELEPGTYYLRIQSDDAVRTEKIVIMR